MSHGIIGLSPGVCGNDQPRWGGKTSLPQAAWSAPAYGGISFFLFPSFFLPFSFLFLSSLPFLPSPRLASPRRGMPSAGRALSSARPQLSTPAPLASAPGPLVMVQDHNAVRSVCLAVSIMCSTSVPLVCPPHSAPPVHVPSARCALGPARPWPSGARPTCQHALSLVASVCAITLRSVRGPGHGP